MNKERELISSNFTVVFDRNVKASELNLLAKNFSGDVIITKKLIIDQNLEVNCNVCVMGKIAHKTRINEYSINIDGNLYCHGEISCFDIFVSGYFYCYNMILAENIKVGENLECDNKINAFGHDVIVAGNLTCCGIKANNVELCGELNVKGYMSVDNGVKTYR